jgi:hypothetical protein
MHLISGHQCFGVMCCLYLQGQSECGINITERVQAMSTGGDNEMTSQYQVKQFTGKAWQQTGPCEEHNISAIG